MRLAVVLVVSIAACRAPRPMVPSEDVRIGRVEDHLLPRVVPEGRVGGRPIGERMARYRVPGASVAVLDEGRVVWARGYGVVTAGGAAVTEASDLARAVAAAGRGPAGPGVTLEGSGAARRWRGSRDSGGSRATVLYYPDRGQGAVVMTNGGAGDLLADEILRAVAVEYAWPEYPGAIVKKIAAVEEARPPNTPVATGSPPGCS